MKFVAGKPNVDRLFPYIFEVFEVEPGQHLRENQCEWSKCWSEWTMVHSWVTPAAWKGGSNPEDMDPYMDQKGVYHPRIV